VTGRWELRGEETGRGVASVFSVPSSTDWRAGCGRARTEDMYTAGVAQLQEQEMAGGEGCFFPFDHEDAKAAVKGTEGTWGGEIARAQAGEVPSGRRDLLGV
jgi:hypothetical protein